MSLSLKFTQTHTHFIKIIYQIRFTVFAKIQFDDRSFYSNKQTTFLHNKTGLSSESCETYHSNEQRKSIHNAPFLPNFSKKKTIQTFLRHLYSHKFKTKQKKNKNKSKSINCVYQ